ncbi:unnamed protein product [Cylicostephanus goldi]|uniref:Uncharacterized protein n=1 Tax=Cylicostephanus goldi TaxID=71465 RepID=A0A3P6S9X8_CYLGO|nr:unnamed protein product [Cylicostephanus goldi]
MAITEDNALSSLHQFLAATQPLQSLQRSPEKGIPSMDDIMHTVLQQLPSFNSYPVSGAAAETLLCGQIDVGIGCQ